MSTKEKIPLSTSEDEAKQALVKAVENVATAFNGLIQAQGGLNVSGMALTAQLLTVQFDALVDELVESSVINREAFWRRSVEKMKECEGGLRKATMETPKIQPAPPGIIKPS